MARSALTAAPMIPISSVVGMTSKRLPCSGLILTISCSSRSSKAISINFTSGPVMKKVPGPSMWMLVAAAAAPAEILLGIQSDDGVPAFPDSFARRIAAKAHAIPERPHARQLMQLALRRRDSRGHNVRVIEQANLRTRSFAAQRGGQSRLQRESLGLMEVGRILHDAVANDSWKADSNGFDFFSARDFFHLPANAIHDAFRGHRLQRVERFHFFWENVGRTKNLVAFHQANGDMFHDEYTDCPAHRAPANLRESKMRTRDS